VQPCDFRYNGDAPERDKQKSEWAGF